MQAPEKDYSGKTALAADNNELTTPNTAKYMSLICCINQSKYENYKILPVRALKKIVFWMCERNGALVVMLLVIIDGSLCVCVCAIECTAGEIGRRYLCQKRRQKPT